MSRKDDPYFDQKVYHMAGLMNNHGGVSALCYSKPHTINLARGQSWTLRAEDVTCPKCRKILAAKTHPPTPKAE